MKRNQNDNNQKVITPYQKWKIQTIENAKGTDINLDLYTVEIEEMPKKAGTNQKMTDAELAEHIRKNATEFFTTEEVALSAYSNADKQKWNTKNPLGAVMKFEIWDNRFNPFGSKFKEVIGNPEDMSVVCSDITATSWIFTTIQTPEDSQHPVSGNREFGLKMQDGKMSFYTQGADRLTGYLDLTHNYYNILNEKDAIFSGADRLWKSVISKVNLFINNNGGKSSIKYKYSRRFKYK